MKNRFFLVENEELEGFDLMDRDAIKSPEGLEDAVVATFYELDKAVLLTSILNGMENMDKIKVLSKDGSGELVAFF